MGGFAIKAIPIIQSKILTKRLIENFSDFNMKTATNAVHTGVVLNKTVPSESGSSLIPENLDNMPSPPAKALNNSLLNEWGSLVG